MSTDPEPSQAHASTERNAGNRGWRSAPFFWAAILLLGLIGLYAPTMSQAGWSYDDRQAILENPLVTGDRPASQAFFEDYWHHRGAAGLYRPLVTLSFRAQARGADTQPGPFHWANGLIHLWVVWLAMLLWMPRRDVRRSWSLAWFALFLFAWHPVQTEAVLWVAGRSAGLCALLGMGSWVAWTRSPAHLRPFWAYFGTALPLLVKEDGLAFAAVFWVLAGAEVRKVRARVAVLVALVVVAALRFSALGDLFFGSGHSPLQEHSFWERSGYGLAAMGMGVRALIWPTRTPLAMTPGETFPWALAVVGATVLLLALYVLRPRSARAGSAPVTVHQWASLAGLAVALLPWMQWIPAPELFGLRFLYLPLLFAIPWLQRAGGRSLENSIALPGLACALLAALCAYGVWKMAPAYQSALGYWSHRAALEPERAVVWNGLGNEEFALENWEAAQASFERATELEPGYSRAWVGLALCAEREGDDSRALALLERALQAKPNQAVAHANLGRLALKHGEFDRAHKHYAQARQAMPGRPEFWRGLARAHWGLQQPLEARAALETVLRLQPSDPIARALWSRWFPDQPAPTGP